MPDIDTFEKPTLILLSDLWGEARSEWSAAYKRSLGQYYSVKALCSCHLAGIDPHGKTEKELHAAFVTRGIDTAARVLSELITMPQVVMGLSMGGTIAWKAALAGLRPQELLVCVSATRLRYELTKPQVSSLLIFGEEDPFRPDEDWSTFLQLDSHVIPDKGHDLYLDARLLTDMICSHRSYLDKT